MQSHSGSEERRQSNIKHKVRDTWWRRQLALLWVIGWLLASLWIFSIMKSNAVEKRQVLLVSMCDERARMLEDQFNSSMYQIHALGKLVSTFHHSKSPSAVDQMTFAKYAERTVLPLISGMAYRVRETHAEREQFEYDQHSWTIKESFPPKYIVTSEFNWQDVEFALVICVEEHPSGLVAYIYLSHINNDRSRILRATESGNIALSPPFKLMNDDSGLVFTLTLYKYGLPATAMPQERIEAAIGYLGGTFDVEALIDKVLLQLADKKSIMVNVYDTTNKRPMSMRRSNDTGSCIPHICHNSTLNFGDPSRRHEMHCRFTQRLPYPWLVLASSYGTLVTALLVGTNFTLLSIIFRKWKTVFKIWWR